MTEIVADLTAAGRAIALSERVEKFVRGVVVPFERDPRWGSHGPTAELVAELRDLARAQDLLTPHIGRDGGHLSQRETASVFRAAGLSPLGPVALNVAAPDEGNMYLLGKVATETQKQRFLSPLIKGDSRSAFLMTEPASVGGAGSDPSMLNSTAEWKGDRWIINGSKAFITGMDGAAIGIVMARAEAGATVFLVELPNPAITIERIFDTLDSVMPGGHAAVTLRNLEVQADQVLGEVGKGFKYAQVRLAPARLSHCMRWLGTATRSHEIAVSYCMNRQAFGKALVDHEGVGFMLADNLIDLKQSELMIDWCAGVLDGGAPGTTESSMTKVAVSEALFRVADRCVQAMGGTGVTRDTIVEQCFREIRAFRIYDGPSEVRRWSLAKHIKRSFEAETGRR
jgi:acyl-CoA dehydrogenase